MKFINGKIFKIIFIIIYTIKRIFNFSLYFLAVETFYTKAKLAVALVKRQYFFM